MASDHWSVTVSRSGEEIVTIETTCLSGREISAQDEKTIRTAAHHLLAFIGDATPASDGGVSRLVAMLRSDPGLRECFTTRCYDPAGLMCMPSKLLDWLATYIEAHARPAAVTASEGEEWLDPSIKDAAHAAVERLEARKGEDVEQWASNLARDLVAAGESEYGDRLRLDVADAIVRDFAEWHQRASKPDGIHFLNGDAGDGRSGDKELMALGERAVSISGNLQRNLAGSSPAPSDDTPTRDELIEALEKARSVLDRTSIGENAMKLRDDAFLVCADVGSVLARTRRG